MKRSLLYLAFSLIAVFLFGSLNLNAQTEAQMKKKFRQAMTQTRNSSGNLFYVAFPYNDSRGQAGHNLAIYVTSSVKTTVNIYNAALGLNVTKNVEPHEITEFSTSKGGLGWDSEIFDHETVVPEALRISSPDPIAVYCMDAKDVTADGYLAIPIKFWGKEYIHCAYYDFNEILDEWTAGFVVVAQEDNTQVTIRVVDGANKQRGFGTTFKGRQHGDVVQVTMNAGDVYMMDGSPDNKMGQFDLSGTIINADKNIGLLSFHHRTTIPQSGLNDGRDYLLEMLPPV